MAFSKNHITHNDTRSTKSIDQNNMSPKTSIAHNDIEAELRQQYPQVSEGIGKLKNYEQSLHIDPQVAPVS